MATLAFSEKGSRSHFWAPVSRAALNSRGVVLNCEKSFVTSAGHADYYVVSSLAVDGSGPTDSTLYLVEKNASGFDSSASWNASAFVVMQAARSRSEIVTWARTRV